MRQRGATLLEFALCSSLLIFLIIGLFEVARVIWVRSMLFHAAEVTLNIAQKEPAFAVNPSVFTSPGAGSSYSRFLAARAKAVNAGVSQVYGGAINGFINYDHLDQFGPTTLPGLVIRPAEQARYTSSGVMINHPTLCRAGAGCAYEEFVVGTPWLSYISKHPIYVEFKSTVTPMLWSSMSVELKGVAIGYLEVPGSSEE